MMTLRTRHKARLNHSLRKRRDDDIFEKSVTCRSSTLHTVLWKLWKEEECHARRCRCRYPWSRARIIHDVTLLHPLSEQNFGNDGWLVRVSCIESHFQLSLFRAGVVRYLNFGNSSHLPSRNMSIRNHPIQHIIGNFCFLVSLSKIYLRNSVTWKKQRAIDISPP